MRSGEWRFRQVSNSSKCKSRLPASTSLKKRKPRWVLILCSKSPRSPKSLLSKRLTKRKYKNWRRSYQESPIMTTVTSYRWKFASWGKRLKSKTRLAFRWSHPTKLLIIRTQKQKVMLLIVLKRQLPRAVTRITRKRGYKRWGHECKSFRAWC